MSVEKTLFIALFQPFAQYRNPFTFYYAQTYPLPPKSTIIGMLQNAVEDWYGNEHAVEEWWNLKVSVHGGFESVFWNYQSLIKGELGFSERGVWINLNRLDKNSDENIWLPLYGECINSQRSPVYQQELFNGHLYIFIRGKEELIDEIKEALESPKKVLYLGRSEDIVFIRDVREVKSEEGISCMDIKLTYPTYLVKESLSIKRKKYPVYSVPVKIVFKNNGKVVKHKAEIGKGTERDVTFKTVIYTGYDYWLCFEELVPVEFYEINGKKFRIIDPAGWL